MLWTYAIPTHATIVTSEADRAVMEVTIDRDFIWAASPGPRVAHRALNTILNRGHPRLIEMRCGSKVDARMLENRGPPGAGGRYIIPAEIAGFGDSETVAVDH
jgi:hypothetical protein